MEDKFERILAEVRQFGPILKELTAEMHVLRRILVTPCVTLDPGDCHTYHGSPSGQVTITNNSGESAQIEAQFGGQTHSAEVQPNSTRTMEPPSWPLQICNQGPVAIVVCAV